jgi:cell division protein FtsI (penicillin-binding protein 3)
MDRKREISIRVYLVFTCIAIFALAIVWKVLKIQYKEGDALREMSLKTHIKEEKLMSDRGNIYSEDGTLLVSSTPRFDLRWDLKVVDGDTLRAYINVIADGLAKTLKTNSSDYFRTKILSAHKRKDRYFLIAKGVKYYEYQTIRNLPILNKKKNKGGFIVESKSQRDNPYKMLALRTLGLWRENATNVGLEHSYNEVLQGEEGSRVLRKSTGNVWIPIEDMIIDPINGKDIVTTIDINIQDVTEAALMESLMKHGCQFGTAIVMETKTGKIKAIANLGRRDDGSYFEDYNYALVLSEPGSTFKLMSLLALIDDGYVNVNDLVNVEGGLKRFGKQRVRDDHMGMGTVTIEKAFAASSNVAFAKLVDQYYSKNPMKYIKHLQDLKLNKKTGIDIAGESTPVIKTTQSKSWNKFTSLPWIAYGYESLISPLHTLMVYNAVANNGKMMKPYLVSEIKEYGKVIQAIEPTVLVERVAKESTIAQLKQAMEAVVENGTGKSVKSKLYKSGGKTGTAQVADHKISYADGVKQGSFVGYFPAEDPQYTIMVLVRSVPHGAYYGAVVAAPVFKTIADKLYASHIGGWAPPKDEYSKTKQIVVKDGNVDDFKQLSQILGLGNVNDITAEGFAKRVKVDNQQDKWVTVQVERGKVPNVMGMGLKDALYMLEMAGLNVRIVGQGKVVHQSLSPNTIIKKGEQIFVNLN